MRINGPVDLFNGKLYFKWLIFPGQVCNVLPDFFLKFVSLLSCVSVLTIFLKYEPQLTVVSGVVKHSLFFFLMA